MQVLLPRLPQQGGGRRTAAVLSLIDLAGSESAKVSRLTTQVDELLPGLLGFFSHCLQPLHELGGGMSYQDELLQ